MRKRSAAIDVIAVHVGTCILHARSERGLSQRALATYAGIRSPMICDIERGRGNPTTATLRRLCTALRMELLITPTSVTYRLV